MQKARSFLSSFRSVVDGSSSFLNNFPPSSPPSLSTHPLGSILRHHLNIESVVLLFFANYANAEEDGLKGQAEWEEDVVVPKFFVIAVARGPPNVATNAKELSVW